MVENYIRFTKSVFDAPAVKSETRRKFLLRLHGGYKSATSRSATCIDASNIVDYRLFMETLELCDEMSPTHAALEQDQKTNDCGDNARRLRTQKAGRNWLLSELAVQSRVCKGTISKIERGDASPMAVCLLRLASTFRFTLAGFLLKAEDAGDPVTRYSKQPGWEDPEKGYKRLQIFVKAANPNDSRLSNFLQTGKSSFPQPGLVPAIT